MCWGGGGGGLGGGGTESALLSDHKSVLFGGDGREVGGEGKPNHCFS